LAAAKAAKPARQGHRDLHHGAPAARCHHPGGLATGQEPGETGHLPDLGEHASSGLGDRKPDVRPDVEDTDLDRRDLRLDPGEERDHLVLLPRVDAERVGVSASAADGRGKRFELVGMAAHDDGGVALAGETAGDRAAQSVAGADDDDRFVSHRDNRCRSSYVGKLQPKREFFAFGGIRLPGRPRAPDGPIPGRL
jgi:hypothetical protein